MRRLLRAARTRTDVWNCILPIQFYAIMKAIYAGGNFFYHRSLSRTPDHTAFAGVVFPCFSRGNRLCKPPVPGCARLGSPRCCFAVADHPLKGSYPSFTFAFSFL